MSPNSGNPVGGARLPDDSVVTHLELQKDPHANSGRPATVRGRSERGQSFSASDAEKVLSGSRSAK